MQGNLNKADAERFMRALTSSVESVAEANPGKQYSIGYSIGFSDAGKSTSEIKAEIQKLTAFIKKFTDQDTISININIEEFGAINEQIAKKAQEGYTASKELEGKKGPLLTAAK